jgi:large subunit ribosomal protein L13
MNTISNYTIKRDTHKIDASGKSVGRLASEVAQLLRGKGKVDFTPQVDNGDFVVVKNAKEAVFTGKKLEQKKYYRHSGYPGGLKVTNLNELMEKDPAEAIRKAVFNMLPNNRLRNDMFKRLTVKN